MKVVVTGGGTGGHINPALALAEELARRGAEVTYAGTPDSAEQRAVAKTGFPFVAFESGGFNRNHPATIVKSGMAVVRGTKAAEKWFARERPDAVVAFGGYACLPAARAAEKLGVPLVVHEQNSVMGLSNKDLSKKAAAVCLTYAEAAPAVADQSKVHVTGNPVRTAVFESTREEGRALLGVPDDALLLLVTGGSQGARHLNQAMCALKEPLLARGGLHVAHVTGPKELQSVEGALALAGDEARRWRLFGYTDRMGALMAACDVIVSRAGASSLAEISARGIPALLVPFPFATADHQTTNARAYVEAGCALMMPDDQVETPAFAENLARLLDDADLRASMSAAAREQGTGDAAAALADVVASVAGR